MTQKSKPGQGTIPLAEEGQAFANPQTLLKAPPEPQASITPLQLIERALTTDIDIDRLGKLMELQERWEKTQARKAFFEALARFQSLVPVISKNKKADFAGKTGGRVSYNFATLDQIISQIQSPLQECGLSYRWESQEWEKGIIVTCIVTHRDGHSESASFSASIDTSGSKNDIQARGSTLTYLRRYTLTGSLGIGTAEDDIDARKKTDGALGEDVILAIKLCNTKEELELLKDSQPELTSNKEFSRALNARYQEIKKGGTK